jgi:hypothetical protein
LISRPARNPAMPVPIAPSSSLKFLFAIAGIECE